MFSLFAKRKLELAKANTETKLIVIFVGILEAAAVASVNYGLTIGDLILVTPIASALSVVTIAMAIVFLKEKITKVQGVGMAMVVVGIALTAF